MTKPCVCGGEIKGDAKHSPSHCEKTNGYPSIKEGVEEAMTPDIVSEWEKTAEEYVLNEIEDANFNRTWLFAHLKILIPRILRTQQEKYVQMVEKMIEEELSAKPASELEKTAEWYKVSALQEISKKITNE